ncbi:hypothetical protein ACLB2K_023116 [Fragaria x ananassa]
MNNQKPVAVLTDGDQAMRRAIEAVLPSRPHRLCTWHISKGFGTLLQLSCTRVRHDLCGFLIGKLDTENCQIELHGKAMEVNSSDFNLIMSVPEGGSDVDLNGSIDDPDMKPLVDYYGGTSGNIHVSGLIKKLDGITQ